jgi:hypothetical protein
MNAKHYERTILFLIVSLILVSQLKAQTVKNTKENWAPNTKSAIENVIKKNFGQKNAYAVFDWDNTSIYGDVQDNLFSYQMENLSFKMTPDEFRYSFTHYTDTGLKTNLEIPKDNFDKSFSNIDGKPVNIVSIAEDCFNDYKYFYENYRKLNPCAAGNLSLDEIKKTDQFKDFRAKMWFTYAALYSSFSGNVAYTWIMYVTAPGFTVKQFRTMVEKAIDWGIKRECKKVYFDSPASLPGAAGAISNTTNQNYILNSIRPTLEMGSLFKKLAKNKIPVYISTASFQHIVEVFATNPKYGYNLPKNHVLGLRLKKDSQGKFLPQYDVSNGYTINSMAGKTANINNFLVKKFKANPVMIGGDSDGDYFMMTELSGLNKMKMINDYNPLQLVLIINRLKGGKIGELCKIAVDQIDGKRKDPTTIVLQGRDENLGSWITTEKTLKLEKLDPKEMKLLP